MDKKTILSLLIYLVVSFLTSSCRKDEDEKKENPQTPTVATCSDGIKNSDETNVDCGGVCPCCLMEPTKFPLDDEINVNNKDSIESGTIKIYIPTFFTPNNDAINDGFSVYSSPSSAITSLNIELTGDCSNLIYSSSDVNFSWNGKLNGTNVKPGIYNYDITCILTNSQAVSKSGKIQLNR